MPATCPPPADPAPFAPADALAAALRRLTAIGGALLLLMSGFRAAFTFRYAHPEIWLDFLGDLPAAFAVGMLHDLRIVLLFLLPPMLSLPWMRSASRAAWTAWLRFAWWWCFAGILALLTVLASDFVFYSYFRSHFSVLAYGFLEDDFAAVAAGAWKNHPLLFYAALILAAGWLLARTLRRAWAPHGLLGHASPHRTARESDRRLNLQLTAHVAAVVALLSWSLSAAPVRMAGELPPAHFVRQVPLNGVEELADAVWMRLTEEPLSVAQRLDYAGRRGAALSDFAGTVIADDPERGTRELLPPQALLPRPRLERSPHVVLVVMESFAMRPLRWQREDFDLLGSLAPHWRRGWLFERFLPSDNGSAGSILSLAVNLPYRPGTKQLSQSAQGQRAFPTASARVFAAAGYETRFLYGGPLTWRRLGEFLALQGFDEIVGQEQILDEAALDAEQDATEWGVFDEHLYAAAARRLREAQRPQFLILFTTTNHPPHELPHDARLPELRPPPELLARVGTLDPLQQKQLRSYQYACDRFGRFLDELEAQGLLEHTVVAATGDHTVGTGVPFAELELLLERAVPFFVLAPSKLAAQFHPDLGRPGSHKDVVPTLAHLAGVAQPGFQAIGSSLLDESAEPLGYNPVGLFLGRTAVVLEFEGGLGSLSWAEDLGTDLVPCEETPDHRAVRRRGRAALALTDWILHEGSEQRP